MDTLFDTNTCMFTSFQHMENADEAQKAVEALNESDFSGNTLSVQVKLSISFVVFTNNHDY